MWVPAHLGLSAAPTRSQHDPRTCVPAGSDRRMKGGTAVKVVHPHVAQLARRTAKVLTVAGIIGAALVVGTWPQRQRCVKCLWLTLYLQCL